MSISRFIWVNCSELEERKTEEITRLFYEIINYFIVWVKKSEKQLIAIKLAKMVEVARVELATPAFETDLYLLI